MLFLFAFSNLSVAVSLLALGKYDSTTLYFLGFAQTFINGILALKGKKPPVWSSVIFFISFTSVSAVKLISDWQSPVDILPLLATMTFVISFAQKDQQKIRLISLFNLIFWATYFFLVHSTAIWTELIAIAAALLVIILPFELFFTGTLNAIPAVLFMCLLILLFIYLSFAPSYSFLNRYLVTTKKSERAMAVLTALDTANEWYLFARSLIRGRSPMILLSSFIGWGAEFLALRTCAAFFGRKFGIQEFNTYINSIFMAGNSALGHFYHILAVVLIFVAMVISASVVIVRGERVR